jgi:hypothetical protein
MQLARGNWCVVSVWLCAGGRLPDHRQEGLDARVRSAALLAQQLDHDRAHRDRDGSGSNGYRDQDGLHGLLPLPEPELHRYFDEDIDRRAVTTGGREAPLADGLRRPLVQSRAEALQNAHAADASVGLDDHFQDDLALDVPATRFLGVLGLDLAEKSRRGNARPGPIRSSARAAPGAGSNAWPGALARPRSAAGATATTFTWSPAR